MRAFWGFTVTGLENVPEEGGVILAGNHVANADGVLIAVAVAPKRFMRGLGKQEVFKVPLLGWWLKANGQIPLDRRGDVGAMRAAVSVLKDGGCLLVLPEGTRSKTGKPGPAKAGLGFLAGVSGAPVIPVHIIGTDRWPRASRVELRFGPGVRFTGDPSDREASLAFGRDVMSRIFAL